MRRGGRAGLERQAEESGVSLAGPEEPLKSSEQGRVWSELSLRGHSGGPWVGGWVAQGEGTHSDLG